MLTSWATRSTLLLGGRRLQLLSPKTCISSSAAVSARRWEEKTKPPFQAELKNPLDAIFGGDFVPEKGRIYDRKPFKVGF